MSPFPTRIPGPGAVELANLTMPELTALRDLDAALASLGERVALRRLALYRDYVGATVSTVSPLLVRWCELHHHDLDQLALHLRPDQPWISWVCGPRPAPVGRWLGVAAFVPSLRRRLRFNDLRRFAFAGIVVGEQPATAVGIRVLHDCLEFASFLGDARLRTFGPGGSITVPGDIPATVMSAAPGRPLEWLVGHPVIDGAGCTIREVREPGRRGTEILFSVRRHPWRMPWVRSGSGEWVGRKPSGEPSRQPR